MNRKEVIQFIREVELLRGLEQEEFKALSNCLVEKHYPRDALLFRENESRKDIFIIYTGEVVLYKMAALGQEKRLAHFSAGDFLGEGSWADDSPHSTSARALEILGYKKGEYHHCHPNNHVNLSQSTNDVYPTAVKIALINSNKKLLVVLLELISSIRHKAEEFSAVIKMGRTQLQDAGKS